MDEDLGDFFSEIAKAEKTVSSQQEFNEGEEGREDREEKRKKMKIEPRVVSTEVVSKPASIEITKKTIHAPPVTIPDQAQYQSGIYGPASLDATPKASAGPPAAAAIPPSASSNGSTPLIMTGSQMLAAQKPVAPLPQIPLQNKKYVRAAGGESWVDPTLNEWPVNDFRLFVGDIGNEVTTEMLTKEFQKYKTFAKAKVIRGGWNNKSKGYGFVSFLDAFDCAKALREMNGKYLGNRPMKIRKSTWKDHNLSEVKKKDKKKRKMAESLGLAG